MRDQLAYARKRVDTLTARLSRNEQLPPDRLVCHFRHRGYVEPAGYRVSRDRLVLAKWRAKLSAACFDPREV